MAGAGSGAVNGGIASGSGVGVASSADGGAFGTGDGVAVSVTSVP